MRLIIGAAALTLALTGCGAQAPSPTGNWIAPDGSSAFIEEDGNCSGMFYNGGQPLDIGGPMTCSYSGETLVVSQPPNTVTYDVTFDGNTMTLTSGGNSVTFTRQ